MFASWFLVGLFFCLPHPDIIHLKNGRQVEGRLVSQNDSEVVIKTGAGEVRIERARIERVERCPWPVDEFDKFWGKVDKKDPIALEQLLDWCLDPKREKVLKGQARKVARRIIRFKPDHAKAQKIMGRVKVEGKWVTRSEAKKLAKQKQEMAAADKERAAAEAKRREEQKATLALIGGVPIAEQVAENKRRDAQEEKFLRDELALDFTVRSSRRISIKGVLGPEVALKFLELGERMCGTLNKELGLPPASSPFRRGKEKRIHFFVVKGPQFKTALEYINGKYTNYDPEFMHYALQAKTGITADGNGCVGIQIDGQEHNEDVFCHYFGHAYVESVGGNMGHWFTEGYAVYCALRFHGNAVHLCTTRSRYAQQVTGSGPRGTAIKLVFAELSKKKMLPTVRTLLKKHMNRLKEPDLAKSWGTVMLFMSDKFRPKFLAYLKKFRYGCKHPTALQDIYRLAPEQLDKEVEKFKVN